MVSRWASSRMIEKSTLENFDSAKTNIERMEEELREDEENAMSIE